MNVGVTLIGVVQWSVEINVFGSFYIISFYIICTFLDFLLVKMSVSGIFSKNIYGVDGWRVNMGPGLMKT